MSTSEWLVIASISLFLGAVVAQSDPNAKHSASLRRFRRWLWVAAGVMAFAALVTSIILKDIKWF